METVTAFSIATTYQIARGQGRGQMETVTAFTMATTYQTARGQALGHTVTAFTV